MKTVVLLSGGLDSAVNLFQAHRESQVVLALTFDYGQRAAPKEVESAKYLCRLLKVPHRVISLPWIKDFGHSALIDDQLLVPQGKNVSIDDYDQSVKTAASVWVPNRNGIFLNIAAGFAEALGADAVVPGFNKEEAATFPDNSAEFLEALNHSFSFSTAIKVRTKCFTTSFDKTKIVEIGKSLGVPFDHLWPCYLAGEHWCGQCESCLRFQRAMKSSQTV